MLNLIQNNDFYLLTLPCLRAHSGPLCAHSVHGPLAPQGGLKSQKFQRQYPPIMLKRIQNQNQNLPPRLTVLVYTQAVIHYVH